MYHISYRLGKSFIATSSVPASLSSRPSPSAAHACAGRQCYHLSETVPDPTIRFVRVSRRCNDATLRRARMALNLNSRYCCGCKHFQLCEVRFVYERNGHLFGMYTTATAGLFEMFTTRTSATIAAHRMIGAAWRNQEGAGGRSSTRIGRGRAMEPAVAGPAIAAMGGALPAPAIAGPSPVPPLALPVIAGDLAPQAAGQGRLAVPS